MPEAASAAGRSDGAGEDYVLPLELLPAELLRAGKRGPRFDDDVWELRPLLRRTVEAPDVRFTRITEPVMRLAAKQYLRSG